jgi:hypothetical protein
LKTLTGVREVRVQEDGEIGGIGDGETAIDVYADRGGSLVSEIASLAELSDVHISEPSLENLFLHHTGRSLRE